MYELKISQVEELLSEVPNFIVNQSNLSAFIFNEIHDLNWVGFYFIRENYLLLAPFQGKPACIRLPEGKGVCWESVKRGKTVIVDDVHEFPGHIACDSDSRSEIVIPLFYNDIIIGVLDIDSPAKSRFTQDDALFYEKCAEILIRKSEVEKFLSYYKS